MNAENGELLKEFTADQVVKLETIIAKHKAKQGGLIPILEEAQVALEYLPISVQKKIARELNLPFSRVYGVVTFYSFFTMTPRGRHTARVCMGTACYIKGGNRILEAFERALGIKVGSTTEDLMFGLETIACFGCCGQAPVVVVNEELHGHFQVAQVPRLLRSCKEAARAEAEA